MYVAIVTERSRDERGRIPGERSSLDPHAARARESLRSAAPRAGRDAEGLPRARPPARAAAAALGRLRARPLDLLRGGHGSRRGVRLLGLGAGGARRAQLAARAVSRTG